MQTDALIVGRVFSDLVFTGVHPPASGSEVYADTFTISPGGAANRAVAAARLGARAALSSAMGDDPIGTLILGLLGKEPGLDLSHVERRAGYHTPISVAITDGPDRAFVTYEQASTPPEWVGPAYPKTIHLSVQDAVPEWAVRARAHGSVLFGGVGWDATGEWSEDVLDRLADVDAVIFNDGEACAYTRTRSADDALEALAQRVQTAVVTQGADGAIAISDGQRLHVPSLKVEAVDPTGAGDTFAAAFMAGTAWQWDLESSLRLATAAAASSVRTPGGALSAPTAADLLKLFQDVQPARGWDVVQRWATRQQQDVHRSRSRR